MDMLQRFLFPNQLIPHGHCYLWQPGLVGLHLVSDVLIAIAYYSIPIMLVYFVRKREDVPFRGIFLLFGLFITTCGTTHLMAVWTLWQPVYWLSGLVKASTALASLYTAIALFPTLPAALALPNPEQLQQINQQLATEIEERKQAEASLRESEERWQLASQGTNDGIWDWNVKTDKVFYSARFKQMLNYHDDEFGDDFNTWFQQVHPDDIEPIQTALQEHFEQNTPYYSTEHRVRCKDGDYKWVLDRGKALRDETGQIVRMTGSYTDITARKMAESALQYQLAFDRLLSEISTRFIDLDPDDSGAEINRALQEIGEFIHVDTSYIFTSDPVNQTLTMCYEWVQFDQTPQIKNAQNLPQSLFPWAYKLLSQGNVLHVPSVARLPVEAAADQVNWSMFNVRSLISVPLMDQDLLWGFIGFASFSQERIWSASSIQFLKLFGEIITRTFQRQRSELALRRSEAELQNLNQDLEARVEERTAALKISEQRFRSLFESAPDFIYMLNLAGIIQQVNSTVIARSGYSQSELMGTPFLDFLKSENQDECKQEFLKLLTTGYHRHEMEFICKDGQTLQMDSSCTVVKEALPEPYILVLQRDITQRKQTEQERDQLFATVKESERRWQSFLNNVQLMVVGLDRLGQVDYINPHALKLMGYDAADVMGKSWFISFLPTEQQRQNQQRFQDILQHQAHPHYQHRLITQVGEERVIAWNSTLLRDLHGQPSGTLSIGEDITERDAVARLKDEFISVVSHELRTPLTAVHGALDLLHSGLVRPESQRGQHAIAIAMEQSERLVQLVNDILELERLESGKITLQPTQLSTYQLLQQVQGTMSLLAEQAGITLVIAPIDVKLRADGDRLIQVLTNLISNAIKFSDSPATVWVAVEEQQSVTDRRVKFTVKDEGRGIPADKLERIFERFHQVDASDSRRKGGTGLGLAICRTIVEQHGGKIWVESTVNVGSCFMFNLPANAESSMSSYPLSSMA
ncbi:MAG: PAS domain S-box protein [Spirulina sp. SIO3F2]|nr:PAS domain S-box protein [Spirulina sp. SIO3F2]